jgi:hypothetical protein
MKWFFGGCAVLAIGFVALVIIGLVIYVGTINSEARLRNQFEAQEKANEVIFDNVWKTISQQAQVTDAYKDGFKEVWTSIVSQQNEGQRNATMSAFISKINPGKFSSALFSKLMNTIEAQRKEFTNNQRKLIDIKREHDNLRTTVPGCWIVGGKPELVLKLVTSGRTNDAFESGRDEDTDVFKRPKKDDKAPAPKDDKKVPAGAEK